MRTAKNIESPPHTRGCTKLLGALVLGATLFGCASSNSAAEDVPASSSTTLSPETTQAVEPRTSSSTTTAPDPNAVLATVLDVGFQVQDIAMWNDQLIARTNEGTEPLSLMRSMDGAEWSEVGASGFSDELAQLEGVFWRDFRPGGSTLAITGVSSEGMPIIAVSGDGSSWDLLDADLEDHQGSQIASVEGEVATLLQPGPLLFEALLREHTSVEVPASGICSVRTLGGGYDADSCGGDGVIVSFSPADITSTFGEAEVLDCASFVHLNARHRPHVATVVGSASIPQATQSFPRGVLSVLSMEGGGTSLIDPGMEASSACEGIVDLPSFESASLTMLDELLQPQWSHPLPDEMSSSFAELVGEISLPSLEEPLVIVSAQQEVWGLIIESGEWFLLADLSEGGGADGSPAVVGTSIVTNLNEGLSVIQIGEDSTSENLLVEDKLLDVVSLSGTGGLNPNRFTSTLILPGGELLVLTSNGRLWTLVLPAPG